MHERITQRRGRMDTLKWKDGVGILEDQEPDEERIHEKNLERTEGRIHELVRKRME